MAPVTMKDDALPQIHLVRDTDLGVFAYELHILAGDFLRESEFNLRSLATNTGQDSIAIMGKNHIWLADALSAYYPTGELYRMAAMTEYPGARAFLFHTERKEDGRLYGDVLMTDLDTLRQDIERNTLYPYGVNMEYRDGTKAEAGIEKWEAMELCEKDALKTWRYLYAPEGYQLDENAYYFAITEDGQVAVVENGEAGRGFTNEAHRGNLKITKDSSDGRKDGFAFEVKNADGSYCETFTSPKSGVIEVKGLRVGIYTVTEISNRASRDYIIPDAATVEIKADETATVQFFNEKPEKPTTPDNPDNPKTPSNPSTPSNPNKPVPQTGDDNFIFLYGGLLALAVIGGGLFAAVYFKKGKYSRNTPKRKAVGIAVVSLCGLLALGSGFLMVRDLNQYSESAGAYEDVASHVELPEQTEAPEDDNTETEPAGEDPSVVLPTVDFEALWETGPDIIGWITLPDTAINYPVTQTDDNEYYLHHLYDGTYNKTGCLFADYENQEDFSDRNTIIYGHNMRDGSMFAALNEYDEQSYFDGHPQMYLVTPGGGYVVEIFTAFVAKPSEFGSDTSPWRLSFKDDGAYTTWLSEMAGRSVIETDVTVTSSDKVLTLSTCTPGGASRFIVMGKLLDVE